MKTISILLSYISILLLLSSCSKEKSIAEALYNNPLKDSVKFGYKISTLYYTDTNNKEVAFNYELEIANVYSWKSIEINYEGSNTSRNYTPEYDITGNLLALREENSALLENIEIEYIRIPPSNIRLVSALKYYRFNNPFALIFNYDSVNLKSVERRFLDRESKNIGGLIEKASFCADIDMGSCIDNSATAEYQYNQFFNNLYHSNELIPFILLLKNPQQSSLSEILPDLPLYFSRHYPSSILKSNPGTFEIGLNSDFRPTFFYFKRAKSLYIQGYNFSLR